MASTQQPATAPTYDLRRFDGSVRKGLTPMQIRAMATAGDLYTDDFLTRSGLTQWRSAAALEGLPVRKRVPAARTELKPALPAPAGPTAGELAALKDQLVAALAARDSLRQDLATVETERNGLVTTCEALTAERSRTSRERDDAAAARLSVVTELESVRIQLQRTVEDVEVLTGEGAAHEAALAGMTRRVGDAEREVEQIRDAARRSAASVEAAHHERVATLLERAETDRRESALVFERDLAAMQGRVDALRHELETHPDSGLRVEFDALSRERDAALARAADASSDREELVAALGHAQDSLRVSDDLRRALEKGAAAAKASVHDHSAEVSQLKAAMHALQTQHANAVQRAVAAEEASVIAARVQDEARGWVARATEQRDAAIRTRDALAAERDGAFAERDATRLAVGATQTDLVKARHELDATLRDAASLRDALTAQTSRAAGLEGALATAQGHGAELETMRDELATRCEGLHSELAAMRESADALRSTCDDMRTRLDESAAAHGALAGERDASRAECAAIADDLAQAREASTAAAQRAISIERELAAEKGKIVARDELIFRESLRTEERESEIRRLSGAIAGLNADLDGERRRAEDALAGVARLQSDTAAARAEAEARSVQVAEAHSDLDRLRKLEHAARAGLAASSAERDQIASALVTANAEIVAREQQASAERGLREQAEASSRQLLASYEKLADETARRITDLEVKLNESAHFASSIQIREEHALASLAEAHGQAKVVAQKLANVEEQRAAVVRDRDSFAKQAKAEASARAAAEDKISGANERAAKAERDGRHTIERAVQAAMIALGGSKQRLDEDYAKSRAEIEVLEQLVAESTQRIIAAGGIVPGIPLMPREAVAAAKAAADAAALIAAQNAAMPPATPKPQTPTRTDAPTRPQGPPVTFRMIDTVAGEAGSARGAARNGGAQHPAPPSRAAAAPTLGRFGGQRERVSQPTTRSEGASDDDSSSPPGERGSAPPESPRTRRAVASLDALWIDDHDANHTAEMPVNSAALLALTALGVTVTGSLAAIPDFLRLDLRGAFVGIGLWIAAAVGAVGLVQVAACRCTPILARRIPFLGALLAIGAPLAGLLGSAVTPVAVAAMLCIAAMPWVVAYAAWPDMRLLAALSRVPSAEHSASVFDRRGAWAARIAAFLSLASVAMLLMPGTGGGSRGVEAVGSVGAALFGLSVVVLSLIPAWRHTAVIPAWGATMVALGSAIATAHTPSAQLHLALAVVGSCAAASVAAACRSERARRMLVELADHEAPALVAHERVFGATAMAASAVLPVVAALGAWKLTLGRSRRAESQLRSLVDFEVWAGILMSIALLAGLAAPVAVGFSPLAGIAIAHAAMCVGAACSIAMDRFVRFPAPMRLLSCPPHGLELPVPLVTVQRTAAHSPHRPIAHPCATPGWALIDVVLGVAAVWLMTRDQDWAWSIGPAMGLAAWLPSFVASRTRHQDALIIGMLASAMLVGLAFIGLITIDGAAPQSHLILAAIAGASLGMWGLLLAWAIAGARHMATSARGGIDARLDASGDPAAPEECPMTVRARDQAMRRIAIGCCALAMAAAAVDGLQLGGGAVWGGPAIGSAIALVATAVVACMIALLPLERLMPLARRVRAALFAVAAIAAVPLVLGAAAHGVLDTIRELPFAIAASTLTFVAGAVLSGLVICAPRAFTRPSRAASSSHRLRQPNPQLQGA